mgnify:FL=1
MKVDHIQVDQSKEIFIYKPQWQQQQLNDIDDNTTG